MSSVTGTISYGTTTQAIYSQDDSGNIDRTKPATYIFKGIEYKGLPATFVDLLMSYASLLKL